MTSPKGGQIPKAMKTFECEEVGLEEAPATLANGSDVTIANGDVTIAARHLGDGQVKMAAINILECSADTAVLGLANAVALLMFFVNPNSPYPEWFEEFFEGFKVRFLP